MIDASVAETGPMIDVRTPEAVLVRIEKARRRFEEGGRVPNAVRELLAEVADALADSGPLELGISPGRWLRAQASVKRAVESLREDRVEVQVRDAKRGLRALRRAFLLAAWSARWRRRFGDSAIRRFGGSRRALRLQLRGLGLVAVGVGTAAESLLQGGVRPVYVLPALVFVMLAWLILLNETTLRLGDAALAREAARAVAGGHRALSGARLNGRPGVELVIATDEHVLAARRKPRQPWKVEWCVPYAQITSFVSDEKDEPRTVTLGAGDRRIVLEYRWRSGEGRGDYQRAHRKVLLTMLERRTGAGHVGDRRGRDILDRHGAVTPVTD